MGVSNNRPATVVPFLPGHVEVYHLQEDGKVESVEMERFHSCTEEPAHATYDTVAELPTGWTTSSHLDQETGMEPVSSASYLQVWTRTQ